MDKCYEETAPACGKFIFGEHFWKADRNFAKMEH